MNPLRTEPQSPLVVPPRVQLLAAFERPYEQAVAAARTCYSGAGVLTVDQVSGVGLPADKQQARIELRDRIAASTFKAGHHTTLQHGYLSFALDGVSRQLVWSTLHAHPFYNSEQVSQRYVEVKAERAAIPVLPPAADAVYRACIDRQLAQYKHLIGLLEPHAEARYFDVFRARAKKPEKWMSAIHKRAQEVARYVLPVATHTWMVHTISLVTLLRYWRLCEEPDTPAETRYVVGEMVRQVLQLDPLLGRLEVEPLPHDLLPAALRIGKGLDLDRQRRMAAQFDEELDGRTSRLVDRFADNPRRVADAVRLVLGLPRDALDDDAAVALAVDPAQNPLWGESLQTGVHQKIGRALHAAHYLFHKKLSHAADSQDQRHRMAPAARPMVLGYLGADPDYVVPQLVAEAGGAVEAAYRASMEQTWSAIGQLRALGVDPQWQAYLLPNAVCIRFSESADLQALRHKHAMRLCYNAQEEIWRASLDEAEQIRAHEPAIGRHLLPPCSVRFAAGVRPICPEGERYCGTPVWLLAADQWRRTL
ncbi:MAG: FAD-dependent thymidylate synthase [Deltaproteobacteria bacterium]|nr:FAD-dependent thymidylate synthase [Deltaproteobacteria bacterium]